MTWPHVSIVVVVYNEEDHISSCVRSILSQTYPAFDLTIVDNASEDSTLDRVPSSAHVRTIPLQENVGFAAAVNVGVRASESKYVALVNADVRVSKDWLFRLVSEMEDQEDIGAAMPKILIEGPGQTINSDGGRMSFLGFAWAGENGRPDVGNSDTVDVPYASGAALVLRRTALVEVGHLDSSYFLYHEDVDLGLRLWRAGYRSVCIRAATVSHDYAPWRRSQKIALLEENRWVTILKNFSRQTLVKALPFLLLAEAMVIVYCLQRRWLWLKIVGMARLLRRLPSVLRERRRLTQQFGRDDWAFLRLCDGRLQDALDEPLRFSSIDTLFQQAYVSFFAAEGGEAAPGS